MSNDMKRNDFDDDERAYRQAAEARRQRRLKKRRHERNMRILFITILVVIIAAAAAAAVFLTRDRSGSGGGSTQDAPVQETAPAEDSVQIITEAPVQTEPATEAPEPVTEVQTESQSDVLAQAETMALGYDYEGAIALLQSVPGYESDPSITQAIAQYQADLDSCVPVDPLTVPHIFYHSLINDTDSAFNVSVLGENAVNGMNAWMTTVEEFDKITQQMYDNGYVFVRLRDLVVETTDENGNVHFEPNNNLLLPPDKKAVVLSVDDLSYYHSYEAASYPDKLVLDENGKVKCHYVKPDGTEEIGDFDVVPRLNTFLEEHPDGAYKGARGMIALTGYNGVFGYRTDTDYRDKLNLMSDQAQWLEEHPEFSWEEDVEQAKIIAQALKDEGWEFASHTWGHLSVTNKTADELRVDNEKWVNTVENIVGPVDTIIFAHGNDIGDWTGYSADNEKYQYFKSAGYNFYCNVDSSTPYWVQITGDYVRQGRIDLDGYQLYQASQGLTTVLDGMFTASEVFDTRRPTPVVANGEA
ncbi:MAG TPA: polysaccharide deacetylase [Candidatus Merdiplasma excrementigallinarum]|uniref:Polysaccharide deacetylase n=1 Tax=Candidatus Merdiplasma excrementigallinarum TaxID=2840864 RepID=A0A9D1T8B0_9FIRM|nr:polysaccharide deacetylase [Candidatus Merdiplasma excrementigallinarum]